MIAAMTPYLRALATTLGLALAACAPRGEIHAAASAGGASAIDLAGMDRSVRPGNDFFAYANGGWIKSHDIPPDRASYGTGAMLDELTNRRTSELIAEAAR